MPSFYKYLLTIFGLFLCTALLFLTCKFFDPKCPVWGTHPFLNSQIKASKGPSLRLVLIILDGVRIQEFFSPYNIKNRQTHKSPLGRRGKVGRVSLWPFLWGKLAKKKHTLILGDKDTGSHCYVNNQYYISLPGYADIFSGMRQHNVTTNHPFSRLKCPSITDRLINLGMPAKDFALFSSWQHIEKVVSRDNRKNIYIDAGYKALKDRPAPPWKDARFDSYLQEDSLDYLKESKHKPRFLSIVYNDADEWGHIGSYRKYLRAVQNQDLYIKKLYDYLESQKEYHKRTVYIITTDHGRGIGKNWQKHGPVPGAKDIWLLVHAPKGSIISLEKWIWMKNWLQKDCSHISIAKLIYRLLSYDILLEQ